MSLARYLSKLAALVGSDGKVPAAALADGAVGTNQLANSGVTAGTYGSASAIPALTVDAKGRVTSASQSAFSSAYVGAKAQLFTSSGTFTVPDGVTSLKITVVGGGGGSTTYWGGTAGLGGCAQGVYPVTAGASYTVTVGAGGASSTGASGMGGGGASSFGALISATGGAGKTSSATRPADGSGSGGTIFNSYGVSNQGIFDSHALVTFQGFQYRSAGSASSLAAVAWSPTLLGKQVNANGSGYTDVNLRPGATGWAQGDPSTVAGGVGGAVLVEW